MQEICYIKIISASSFILKDCIQVRKYSNTDVEKV